VLASVYFAKWIAARETLSASHHAGFFFTVMTLSVTHSVM
jgi:hypothetical protein